MSALSDGRGLKRSESSTPHLRKRARHQALLFDPFSYGDDTENGKEERNEDREEEEGSEMSIDSDTEEGLDKYETDT